MAPAAGHRRWPFPRVIAHRGGGTLAPENTLAGIRTGHRLGCHAVEFDVVLGGDGVAVLMHDDTVDRTTNGHGNVFDLDSGVLSRLDAGSWHGAAFKGEPVPTFEAAANLCVTLGLWANVEIKPATGHEADTGRVAALIARSAWRSAELPPLLSSFQPQALIAAHEAAPELPLGLLFDAVPMDWSRRLEALHCVSLHCNAAKLTEPVARDIISAGYGLAVWTVNDPAEGLRLFALGADAVFTDRPDLLLGLD